MSAESHEAEPTSADAGTVEFHVAGPMALVDELWHRWHPIAADAGGDSVPWRVAGLQRSLAAVAAAATRLTLDGAPGDRGAARLLGDTAQTVHDVLGRQSADEVTPWKDRLRLARLERWLAARAETDADAKSAASLCLWVIEHLEMSVPLPRRIPPA